MERLYIDGEYGSDAKFVNHSCNPNCAFEKKNINGLTRCGIFAKRYISVGTEITADNEHLTNPVKFTGHYTATTKIRARAFHPITNLIVHTTLSPDGQTVHADWGAMQPPLTDNGYRGNTLVFPPNRRRRKLGTEEDCSV